MEPPNYKETHYRFGEQCRNCKFKDEKPDTLFCSKYGLHVMPHFVCDNWERDGMVRIH